MKVKLTKFIFRWIMSVWFPCHDKKSVYLLIDKIDMWLRTRGPKWTIQRLKDLRRAYWGYVGGAPCRIPYLAYKGDLPRVLNPWRAAIESRDIPTLRLVNTILNISKTIRWWAPSDYSSITTPSKANPQEIERVTAGVVSIWEQSAKEMKYNCQSFHFTASMGPNGPALLSAMIEAVILPEHLINNIGLLGGEFVSKHRENCARIVTPIKEMLMAKYKLRDNAVRRIAHRLDLEGKRRPIGILDYWSQTSLKPLHDVLFKVLRKMPGDMTFDQGKIARYAAQSKGPYFCYDLQNATDRFPLSLQVAVLEVLLGKEKAEAVGKIMSQEPFLTPEGHLVKYEVGQPLGGYASWALFSLCHHLVVQYSARQAGFPGWFTGYWILGDDIVIRDREVASRYLNNIHALGVDISLQKSLVSEDTFEFAKRVFYKGTEFTGLSLNAIMETKGRWIDLWAYFMSAEDKGWQLPDLERYDLIKELLYVLGNSRSYATRAAKYIWGLDIVRHTIQKYPYNQYECKDFMVAYGMEDKCSGGGYAQAFLLECVAALKVLEYQNSLIATVKSTSAFMKEFAALAVGRVDLTQDDLYSLPFLGISSAKTRQIGSDKMTVETLARSQDWIGLLRSGVVLLPDPNRVLSHQSSPARLKSEHFLITKLVHLVKGEFQERDKGWTDFITTDA